MCSLVHVLHRVGQGDVALSGHVHCPIMQGAVGLLTVPRVGRNKHACVMLMTTVWEELQQGEKLLFHMQIEAERCFCAHAGELFVKALIRRTAQRLRQTPYAGNMRAGLVGAGFQMGPSAGGAAALQMRPAPAMAGGYQKRPPPEGSAFQSQPVAFNRTIATPRGPTIVMREL